MNKVAVLMSTFNGEKYLVEQIESILGQKNVEIHLFIRDDGSADGTIKIVESFIQREKNIELIKGDNVGVGNSFMQLVHDAGNEYDYYSFSDQDDIWLPEKLDQAITFLHNHKDTPYCYCSNQTLIDANGKIIGKRHQKDIDTGYMQILCNNLISGCTMVWNNAFHRLLSQDDHIPSPELLKRRIHDVWVGIVAAVAGNIYYDPNAYILYRQHENNVVGVRQGSRMKEWKKKLLDPSLRNGRSMLAYEIISHFDKSMMDNLVYEHLYRCAHYKDSLLNRIQLMKDQDIRKHSNEDKISFDIKVLFGLL